MSQSKGLILPVLYAHSPKLGPDMTRAAEDWVFGVLLGPNGLTAGSSTRSEGASDCVLSFYLFSCVFGYRAERLLG
jgi:hypothetical protein